MTRFIFDCQVDWTINKSGARFFSVLGICVFLFFSWGCKTGVAFVDVKDFGVVGDGVADDTLAFQKTIDVGRDIYFNNSLKCKVNGLFVRSPIKIFGGGTLIARSPGIIILTVSSPDVKIEDLNFVGTGSSDKMERGIFSEGTNNRRGFVSGCSFSNLNWAIHIGWSAERMYDWKILNNNFFNIGARPGGGEGYGVLTRLATNFIITENSFHSIGRHAVYLSVGAKNCIVSRNIIDDTHWQAIAVYSKPDQEACEGNIISENIISNATPSASSNIADGIGIDVKSNNNLVIGNIINNCSRYGIELEGTGVKGAQLFPQNNIIKDNHFYGTFSYAIHSQNSEGTIIDGNTGNITTRSGSAIRNTSCGPALNFKQDAATVINNTFFLDSNSDGIRFSQDYGRVFVAGNRFPNISDKSSKISDGNSALRSGTYSGHAFSCPTTGIWKKGDIVWNDVSDQLDVIAWVCTKEGALLEAKWSPIMLKSDQP